MMIRRALGFLLGLVARAWLASLRLTLVLDPALSRAGAVPWSLAFWHGHQFALLRWPRRRPTVALVSRSPDGELLASAFTRLGMGAERGSSSRAGASGLKAIVRRLRKGLDAAFAVDGPRGPRGMVQSASGGVGAALGARLAGGVVVPMAAAAPAKIVFSRSWDRFELPLPFSRVAIAIGAPIDPRDATPARLAEAIDEAHRAAEQSLAPPRLLAPRHSP
jgi:lysophospholipid acyltransferase (LPLAT)-like uncharacterized protein